MKAARLSGSRSAAAAEAARLRRRLPSGGGRAEGGADERAVIGAARWPALVVERRE